MSEYWESKPQTFDGEKPDHWVFKKWILHTEKPFLDTFVLDDDRVWFATHHLEGDTYQWWVHRDDTTTDLAATTWPRFKEMFAMAL